MDLILLELLLVLSAALGLGFWQLYDVNKEIKKGESKDDKNKKRSGENETPDKL